jgi:hypothetical protein
MSRQLFEDAKKVLLSEATILDPVGRENKDINNDGRVNRTDSYLLKRRGAISAAIAQSKKKGVKISEEDAQRLSDILRGLDEGSVSKEDQKTPYPGGINSPESRAAASAQRERMASADKAKKGKELLDRIKARKGVREGVVAEGGIETPRKNIKQPPAPGTLAHAVASGEFAKFGFTKSGKETAARKRQRMQTTQTTKNEEVEQIDELGNTPGGREALLAVRGRAIADRNKDFPDHYTPRAMKAQDIVNRVNDRLSGNRTKRLAGPGNPDDTPYTLGGRDRRSGRSWSEEVDLQEYDLIEKFNVNIPGMPSYQDYVNAALKIAECKAFSELSEEDQEYIMNELEEAAATNDVSFILEAEAMSDMNDTVQRLEKAGHTIEDKGRDYRGNPFYVYIDKMSGMRRKVTYKGNQKMTQNMGRVQTDKEDVAEANDTLGSQFDDFMASRNANRKPGQPMMKPRTAQSVIKPGGPQTPEDALAHLVQNIPSGIKQVGFPKK